ncbi:cadherin EGF LAG seven-pass G-type receptor 3-like, partial [Polyodon spathula]|uniref:cadherin EGF LAG seven-pass G-type receptor 3-like n=1 Tax=Polyodon spathula TaxID=7913 RepID=UPI001B7F16B7
MAALLLEPSLLSRLLLLLLLGSLFAASPGKVAGGLGRTGASSPTPGQTRNPRSSVWGRRDKLAGERDSDLGEPCTGGASTGRGYGSRVGLCGYPCKLTLLCTESADGNAQYPLHEKTSQTGFRNDRQPGSKRTPFVHNSIGLYSSVLRKRGKKTIQRTRAPSAPFGWQIVPRLAGARTGRPGQCTTKGGVCVFLRPSWHSLLPNQEAIVQAEWEGLCSQLSLPDCTRSALCTKQRGSQTAETAECAFSLVLHLCRKPSPLPVSNPDNNYNANTAGATVFLISNPCRLPSSADENKSKNTPWIIKLVVQPWCCSCCSARTDSRRRGPCQNSCRGFSEEQWRSECVRVCDVARERGLIRECHAFHLVVAVSSHHSLRERRAEDSGESLSLLRKRTANRHVKQTVNESQVEHSAAGEESGDPGQSGVNSPGLEINDWSFKRLKISDRQRGAEQEPLDQSSGPKLHYVSNLSTHNINITSALPASSPGQQCVVKVRALNKCLALNDNRQACAEGLCEDKRGADCLSRRFKFLLLSPGWKQCMGRVCVKQRAVLNCLRGEVSAPQDWRTAPSSSQPELSSAATALRASALSVCKQDGKMKPDTNYNNNNTAAENPFPSGPCLLRQMLNATKVCLKTICSDSSLAIDLRSVHPQLKSRTAAAVLQYDPLHSKAVGRQRRGRRRRRAGPVLPLVRARRATNRHPLFPQYNYQVQVAENQPPGTSVIAMNAQDPDPGESGRLSYSMAPLMNSRSIDYFSIHPSHGLITTTKVLDREHMDLHYFRVTAVDHGQPRLSATTMVAITVSDRNDHDPMFEQTEYRETIRENVEEGYPILQLRATDSDAPSNANIRYRFVSEASAPSRAAFEIDPRSGLITTRGPVDREQTEQYSLVVEASDQGREPGPRSANVKVFITVLDENDNVPQFSEKRYVVQVREDVRLHSEILRVSATDLDKDSNALLHYNIISGNSRGQFSIDSVTGEIQVVAPLDFEVEREYALRVRAQDAGRPPLSNNTGMVSVQVVDVNDNAPIFVSTPFQVSVLENVPLGHSVIHVQAVDTDSGDNARLEYKLTDTLPDTPFVINSATGWVTVSRALDREAVEHYFFGVEAQDYGTPSLSASASVTITVMDVNDNRPEFGQREYFIRLNEDAAVGTSVLSVTAVDRDVNSAVTYQITGGNTRNRFSISTQGGAGLISLALPLDYKQERRYILTVTASDRTLHDTCQVHVNITDANTHRPVFQSTHFSVGVAEDRLPGSTVVVISATDDDVGENARITYFLEDNIPQFRIDSNTGAITLQAELDYEDQMTFTLAITARDNGIPQKSDTTYVEVNVKDVNDNAPQFVSPRYQGTVMEDTPPFTSVLQISATDRDAHANGWVQYTFQNGEDGDGDFTIEPTSGIVRTVRQLDRESIPFYELTAYAVDRGLPPQRTPVHIQVSVLDVNDNAPVFPADDFQVFVKENSAVGSVVAQITATDPDEGPHAQIMYQIVEGNIPEIFQMDIFSGELTTLIDLDYEARSEYAIVVQATSAPLVSRATVRIKLVDQNDNGPVLQNFQIIFNNFVSNKSNSFPSGVIGRVPARDPDVSDRLHYSFERGNELNLLLLNHTSGELRLSRKLDNNRPLVASMLVTVSDGIHSVTAQCVLRVLIITEDMLSNSVTVRLQDVSQDRFLSPLLGHFLDGVSSVLSVPQEDIFVFNIQQDGDADILNVSFSALLPGGLFLPSEALEEQLYLSRPRLTARAMLEVLPFDDNVCLREPCQNYMKCVSVLQFNSSAPFISSASILFRPIHPITGLRCRCPPGFTGDYCDTEINLCYSKPCLSGGVCTRREGGYSCVCREGYTGERCEVDSRAGRCVPGVCGNGGTCTELLEGGFRCDCPSGGFEKPYCTVTTRSFPPKSFIMFRGLRQRFHLSISLSFATLESSGLLLYNGRFNEKHDFIALEIVEGQVQLQYSTGESSTQVSPYLPGGVSDGNWHTVQIQYYNKPKLSSSGEAQGPSEEKVAVVTLDDCDTALALRFRQQISNYSCAAQGVQSSSKKSLDLTGPLLLGGVPNLPENFPVLSREFIGCMKDLHIDNRRIDMAGYIANNGTLPGCSAKLSFCDGNPCKNGGTCRVSWKTFSCECPLGFGGKDCSHVMQHPHRFLGNSALWWDLKNEVTVSLPWYLGLMFRTRAAEGVLLQAHTGQYTSMAFQLDGGQLSFLISRGSSRMVRLLLDQVQVDDGKWHDLQLELTDVRSGRDTRYVATVQLDFGRFQSTVILGNDLHGLKVKHLHVGGVLGTGEVQSGVRGCIQGVRLGDTPVGMPLPKPTRSFKVESGCSVGDPCDSSPCPSNSYCSDDWQRASCLCDP